MIDSNLLCWAAAHSMRPDTVVDDMTIVFDFLNRVLFFAKMFSTRNFGFFWDSRRSIRREMFPKYKSGRAPAEDDEEGRRIREAAYKQMDILREQVLPAIGMKNSLMQDGIESDDLIAKACGNVSQGIIVSSDKDMYQCLTDRVRQFNPSNRRVHTPEWLMLQYGVYPSQWAMVKALAGCKSDTVPGIRGVGEATAAKYLQGRLRAGTATWHKITGFEGQAVVERNLPLVTLPLPETEDVHLVEHGLDLKGFRSVIEEFGFESFKARESEWLDVFGEE